MCQTEIDMTVGIEAAQVVRRLKKRGVPVRNRGGAIKLLNITRRLTDLLVVTRLLTMFDCFDGEAEALASFADQPVSQ